MRQGKGRSEVYYEDIELGLEVEIGRHTVDRDEIVRFAAEWDPQPFHVDEEAAYRSVFGGLTASSCHTYALTALIFHRSGAHMKTAAMLGMDEVRFPTAVRPGDQLTLTQTILEKRRSKSRPQLGVVKSRSALRNAAGEPVMVMTSNFMVETRS